MISLHPYTLFGTLEALIIVLVLAIVAFSKWRSERHNTAALRQQLQQARTEVRREVVERIVEPSEPQRDYGDFLREQLEQSSILLGEDTQPRAESGQQEAGDALARQMLAARHQFLQLEMDVQSLASAHDAEAQRRSVIEGMQALLSGLTLSVTDTAVEPVAEVDVADAAPDEAAPISRSEEDKLREQITYLRTVIDNQHNVMRELRRLLEEHGGDSEALQEALRKLGDAEAQGVELGRCLEVMEQENERLKQAVTQGDGKNAALNPDADMLRDLVGSQQRTISKLQHMLQSLAPDSGKANELADAIGKIQRANNELNSCVMVLEDENTMLRGQVETLQERLADLEASGTPEPKPAIADSDPGPESDIEALAEESEGEEAGLDVDALLEASAASEEIPVLTELGEVMDDQPDSISDTAAEADVPATAPEPAVPVPLPDGESPESGGEANSGDIDTLLAELFADSNQAGSGSKS